MNIKTKDTTFARSLSFIVAVAIVFVGVLIVLDASDSEAAITEEFNAELVVGETYNNEVLMPGDYSSGTIPGLTITTTMVGGVEYVRINGTPTTPGTYYIVAKEPVLQNDDYRCTVTVVASATPAVVHEATINLQPGETWSWTPTFTSGLSPTLSLSVNEYHMPDTNDLYAQSFTNAKIVNGGTKLKITIPSDYDKSKLYVMLKAETAQPRQVVYYGITVDVATYSLNYSSSTIYGNVGSAITSISPTIGGGVTASSYAIQGTLPSGLSLNTSTGVISGTPTAYKAQTNYVITATLNTTPVHYITKTVSIGAYTNITASNYTVYAIKGQTNISVPGVSMPTGTVLSGMTLSATKDGSTVSVSTGTAYNGMTVAANTGAISGTPNTSGTYIFTENYTATAATGGSTASRTVTVVVEDKVAITGDSSFHSFISHEDTITLTKSAGPNAVAWSIIAIKKNGTTITSGTDFNSFSINNGVLKSSTATTAGTYVVTVKLVSTNTTNNTSGATGASPSNNYATKEITVTVGSTIEITNNKPIYFYEATNKVYDALTLLSNVEGAIFSITTYGNGITSTHINVASNGVVTPGTSALTAGDYTVTVKAQDPNNPTNFVTETLIVRVIATLEFTNTPSIGILGE